MEIIKNNLISVRQFKKQDIKQLHQLMHELAVFESYDDQFKITERHIEKFGLTENPKFHCFVAHPLNSNQLLGMAVVHVIDWTFDLKPTMILKELYVKGSARGQSVGHYLMKAVANHAKQHKAPRLKWLVLKTNLKAKQFYQKFGATHDSVWENWEMDEPAIEKLIN